MNGYQDLSTVRRLLHDTDFLLGMATSLTPSSSPLGSDSSRESSPVDHDVPVHTKAQFPPHVNGAEAQNSRFLLLPVDIFKCVIDFLDRDALWALKRVSRGTSRSQFIDELLFRYPIQFNDVRDLRLGDWYHRSIGLQRWTNFRKSVNDSNRPYVHRLAMSHWCCLEDFKWIEENLPALTSLELTAIKDFVWTPAETWSWRELADACPKLFGRITELAVSNWADYNAHDRIEYSYSYNNDYRFSQKFRISRRRDGGSVAKIIFPLCTKLETLAVRERFSCFHSWSEYEVHQRVCVLVDGIVNNCPPTLTTLRVHDYAPYRCLFSTDIANWDNLSRIEFDLFSWMEERRDSLLNIMPYRITAGGNARREAEGEFEDGNLETCQRNHMEVGQSVVQGANASLEELLLNVQTITQKYPHISVNLIEKERETVIQPFHLITATSRRSALFQPQQQNAPVDPITKEEVQDALRWLAEKCGWRPILSWDNLMSDVFPENLEPFRTFFPRDDLKPRVESMLKTLKSLGIPIRISIGERGNSCSSSALDGTFFFGDYKTFVGEGDEKRELFEPTEARFNLGATAYLVDELCVHYPMDAPGLAGWRSGNRLSDMEKELLRKEMKGWRKFWYRYAHLFRNLKKLTVVAPRDIYNDWGKSALPSLLQDQSWEMLEIDEKFPISPGVPSPYVPLARLTWSLSKKRSSRLRFVHRVFFREKGNHQELQLDSHPTMTSEDIETKEISDSEIATNTGQISHRFWLMKGPILEKRKAEEGDEAETVAKRARIET